MVKTCKLKSTFYFEYIKNNIQNEEQKLLIETVLTTAALLLSSYVPDSSFETVCKDMFETIYEMICNEKRKDLLPVLTSSLFKFLHTDDHTNWAIDWLKKGSICDKHGNKIEGWELNKSHKHAIVVEAHSKRSIDADEKQKLLDEVIGDDKSDVATNLKLACKASIPDKESKEKVWNDITDHTNNFSSYERAAMMTNFFKRDAADILEPYFDKYIECVHTCADCGNKNFIDAFVNNTCPSYNITDTFIESLKKIASEHSTDLKYESYTRTVSKVAGSLEINKKIKDFSE